MKKFKRLFVYVIAIVLIIIDQIIKLGIINNLKGNSISIIKGILKFTYCENEGVAFSLGSGHVPVFIIVTLILVGGLIFYFEKNRKDFNIIGKMFFIMVISGGISNLLDRIFRGFVVDFIDISDFIGFAIFNVADILIVAGMIGLSGYLFYRSILEVRPQIEKKEKEK